MGSRRTDTASAGQVEKIARPIRSYVYGGALPGEAQSPDSPKLLSQVRSRLLPNGGHSARACCQQQEATQAQNCNALLKKHTEDLERRSQGRDALGVAESIHAVAAILSQQSRLDEAEQLCTRCSCCFSLRCLLRNTLANPSRKFFAGHLMTLPQGAEHPAAGAWEGPYSCCRVPQHTCLHHGTSCVFRSPSREELMYEEGDSLFRNGRRDNETGSPSHALA